MPRSRARRFRRRRPWRASRALANGSQLAGSHTPQAPTCRKHARRVASRAANRPYNNSFCQVGQGWPALGRTPAGKLYVFISNIARAPSTHSASPRRSAWLTRRSAWVSRHFCLNSCHSIGVSRSAPTRPPACVRACACVPVARVWSMGGRTKCILAETPPQLLAVSGAVTRIETCIQQLLWGKNANGTSLMYLM